MPVVLPPPVAERGPAQPFATRSTVAIAASAACCNSRMYARILTFLNSRAAMFDATLSVFRGRSENMGAKSLAAAG